MDTKRSVKVSKFLSRILRHAPEDLGLTLESGGWVPIGDLLAGASKVGMHLTRAELDEVVRSSDKQRFAFDDTGTKIRANQGHSTEVDLQLEPVEPLPELFHGTTTANLEAILHDGLLKMARHHVHLSADTPTALKVGGRHGKPVLLHVDAARMRADGHIFFLSANGVWLVDHVPPQYLRVMTPEN
ncbi:MAG: RNA 2'-phosphotransferase [Planctomycetes bacterium]|nr:RNA 2'-phosphotransferase [Planctomycetota bacterium]